MPRSTRTDLFTFLRQQRTRVTFGVVADWLEQHAGLTLDEQQLEPLRQEYLAVERSRLGDPIPPGLRTSGVAVNRRDEAQRFYAEFGHLEPLRNWRRGLQDYLENLRRRLAEGTLEQSTIDWWESVGIRWNASDVLRAMAAYVSQRNSDAPLTVEDIRSVPMPGTGVVVDVAHWISTLSRIPRNAVTYRQRNQMEELFGRAWGRQIIASIGTRRRAFDRGVGRQAEAPAEPVDAMDVDVPEMPERTAPQQPVPPADGMQTDGVPEQAGPSRAAGEVPDATHPYDALVDWFTQEASREDGAADAGSSQVTWDTEPFLRDIYASFAGGQDGGSGPAGLLRSWPPAREADFEGVDTWLADITPEPQQDPAQPGPSHNAEDSLPQTATHGAATGVEAEVARQRADQLWRSRPWFTEPDAVPAQGHPDSGLDDARKGLLSYWLEVQESVVRPERVLTYGAVADHVVRRWGVRLGRAQVASLHHEYRQHFPVPAHRFGRNGYHTEHIATAWDFYRTHGHLETPASLRSEERLQKLTQYLNRALRTTDTFEKTPQSLVHWWESIGMRWSTESMLIAVRNATGVADPHVLNAPPPDAEIRSVRAHPSSPVTVDLALWRETLRHAAPRAILHVRKLIGEAWLPAPWAEETEAGAG
ncbi:hypothetical protein ACFQMH_07600, partial [Streptomyces viridiviolaceus]